MPYPRYVHSVYNSDRSRLSVRALGTVCICQHTTKCYATLKRLTVCTPLLISELKKLRVSCTRITTTTTIIIVNSAVSDFAACSETPNGISSLQLFFDHPGFFFLAHWFIFCVCFNNSHIFTVSRPICCIHVVSYFTLALLNVQFLMSVFHW
jgi:hypothetical protein